MVIRTMRVHSCVLNGDDDSDDGNGDDDDDDDDDDDGEKYAINNSRNNLDHLNHHQIHDHNTNKIITLEMLAIQV